MDQISTTNGLELPAPDQAPNILNKTENESLGTDNIELQPSNERLSTANDAVNQASYGLVAQNIPQIKQDNSQINQTAQTSASSSLIADDVDVIEKAWVQKAKTIVENTKEDPHRQSVELSHVKYDYIKKRYDKDIKLPDDQQK